MEEHRKNGVDVVIVSADPDRSRRGAWLLDASVPFETLIPDIADADARTLALHYQRLGAVWDENWFDRVQRNGSAFCPDITRSMGGAWILPGTLPIETLVQDMKVQDPSRTTADCFQLVGGVWDEEFFIEPIRSLRRDGEEMTFFYLDPLETQRERIDRTYEDHGNVEHEHGVAYTWAWTMTKKQKAAADRLKEHHPDWKWSQCYEEVGGRWVWRKSRVR
jgi:hypothetical protein